jgi:hypothetical protein
MHFPMPGRTIELEDPGNRLSQILEAIYEQCSKGGIEFKLDAQLDSADTLAAYTGPGPVLFHRQRSTIDGHTQWYRYRSNGRQDSGR